MAFNPKAKSKISFSSSSQSESLLSFTSPVLDDDDFQDCPSLSLSAASGTSLQPLPLKPHSSTITRPRKKPRKQNPGKENRLPEDLGCGLDSIEPTLDLLKSKWSDAGCFSNRNSIESKLQSNTKYGSCQGEAGDSEGLDRGMRIEEEERLVEFLEQGRKQGNSKSKGSDNEGNSKLKGCAGGCFSNSTSIESKLLKLLPNSTSGACEGKTGDNEGVDRGMRIEEEEKLEEEDFLEEGGTQFNLLLKLCVNREEQNSDSVANDLEFWEEENCDFETDIMCCPLCDADISELSDDSREAHTNECLDKVENSNDVSIPKHDMSITKDDNPHQSSGEVLDGSSVQPPQEVVDTSPVIEWLCNLGLAKYEDVFVREEIDWSTLQCLTDEDLCSIGITALGPRKKIVHALRDLRKDVTVEVEVKKDTSKNVVDETKAGTNKLITDYFSGHFSERSRAQATSNCQKEARSQQDSAQRSMLRKGRVRNEKQKDIPLWCCIPGTSFRVDAFKYLRRECSHWFLTHFHLDHYQGLTRSFCHGMIYCSSITAKLINLKIGIPWEKIQVLPLNQKINVAGVNITCFDANHCPGAIIILFELPNGKAVLHTGDFRFCEEMTKLSMLQTCPVQTLILDTTYCDPRYDFPKQEAVIQFVIEAIQAEAFNPKTLFLIGSYTIGKERLFMEVARTLGKKVHVNAAKLRLLKCLDLPEEDMQWLTTNELESHIHVVPMWSIASFKRLKHISKQYASRFSLIVAFSPTGWSFGKGKKKSPGRRWQQGTIIRYEVPYSEHSSFIELQEFVKFISPVEIIPSVNNHGPDSQKAMVSQLCA